MPSRTQARRSERPPRSAAFVLLRRSVGRSGSRAAELSGRVGHAHHQTFRGDSVSGRVTERNRRTARGAVTVRLFSGETFAIYSPMRNTDTNITDQPALQRDPDEWKTGNEPMTDAQRSYLETLCRETGEEFDETLSKADASKRIDELRQRSPRLASE